MMKSERKSVLNPIELKEFVEANPKLVQRKESKRYPGLYVLKYTRKVFYDNLWETNAMLLECRGLVVDEDYNTVVKPFTKVFNRGENGTEIDRDEMCTVVRKVNGFMACATKNTKYSDKLIISTTGSLDSEHVDIAARHIKESWFEDMFDGETLIFEICDTEDPHIVTEQEGAWLIGGNGMYGGYQYSEKDLNTIADGFAMLRPETYFDMIFSEVLKKAQTCDHEGYMVYSPKGQSLKLKSPYYLTTKFLARMKDERLLNMLKYDTVHTSMRNFDEEYYPLIQFLRDHQSAFVEMEEQERIQMIRNYFNEVKE